MIRPSYITAMRSEREVICHPLLHPLVESGQVEIPFTQPDASRGAAAHSGQALGELPLAVASAYFARDGTARVRLPVEGTPYEAAG
jgi:hypothetical protein